MSLCPTCKRPLVEPTKGSSSFRDLFAYISFEFSFWVLLAGLLSWDINVYFSGGLAFIGAVSLVYVLFFKNEVIPPSYCLHCDKTFDQDVVDKAQRHI